MKFMYKGKAYTSKNFLKEMPFKPKKTLVELRKKWRESALKSYYKNKDKRILNVKLWQQKNPEKVKEYQKKKFAKWYSKKKNKIYMKNKMKEYYEVNSEKQRSRTATYKVVNGWKANPKYYRKETKPSAFLIKECKKCKGKEKLQIHHEVYPTTLDGVRKEIKMGNIYYLCRPCHLSLKCEV